MVICGVLANTFVDVWLAASHLKSTITHYLSILFCDFKDETISVQHKKKQLLVDCVVAINTGQKGKRSVSDHLEWTNAQAVLPCHLPTTPFAPLNNHWPLLLRDDWVVAFHRCVISFAETELERLRKGCPQEWLWLFLSTLTASAQRVTVRDIIYLAWTEKQKITVPFFQ